MIRWLLIALLLVSSCTSKKKNTACSVDCPEGSICEQNRCIPQCVPPCSEEEYCGADRTCKNGAKPEAGVFVSPLDGGLKKDALSQAQDGPAGRLDGPLAEKDSALKPDADPNAALCSCLSKQKPHAYCAKQKTTCQAPEECCNMQNPIPCGVYTNKYTCQQGQCHAQGCTSDGECVTYAKSIQAANPQNYVCHQSICPHMIPYCGPKLKTCKKDQDCCALMNGSCGSYPNNWRCDEGKCSLIGCRDNAECFAYAQSLGMANPQDLVCRLSSPCTDYKFCVVKGKPCSSPQDCCAPNSTIPCGVYANRYRCENHECVLDRCLDKQDCVSYATSLKDPGANDYSCIAVY